MSRPALIASISENTVAQGSIILAQGQTGGQVAHSIHNYGQSQTENDTIAVEGKLTMTEGMDVLQTFGCPGLILTVINRAKRQAKIKGAWLCVEGKGFMDSLQQGFGPHFCLCSGRVRR